MKLTKLLYLHKYSIQQVGAILITLSMFSMILNAQIKIKERVEIVPQKTRLQTTEVQPSLTYVVPFSGIATITIYAYLINASDVVSVTMNEQVVIPDILNQWPKWDIPLGEVTQGQSFTFTLKHGDGSIWAGEGNEAEDIYKPDCFRSYWMSYNEACSCGDGCYCYVYLVADFTNMTAEKNLEGGWDGTQVIFGNATSLNSIYTEKCWEYTGGGSSYPLPAGTTFTYSITGGSEYATLIDPNTGAMGSVLSGLPQDNGTCSVTLLATGTEPTEPTPVTVEVQTTAAGINTYGGQVIILPGPGELLVVPTKSSIMFGESLTFDVTKIVDGISVPLPEGTSFSYTITSGADAGYLSGGSETGDEIYGEFSSVDFTAVEETPQGDSTHVGLWVEATEPGGIIISSVKTKLVAREDLQGTSPPKIQKVELGEFQQYTMQKNTDGTITYDMNNRTGCGTAQKIVHQEKSTTMQKTTHGIISNGKKIQTRSRIGSSILGTTSGEIYWYVGGATVTVKKENDCILVAPEKDTLALGETTQLHFTHVVDGVTVGFPAGQLFNVLLSGPGSDFGYLQAGAVTGATLIGVAEPIYYVAPSTFEGDFIAVSFSAMTNSGGSAAAISQSIVSLDSIRVPLQQDQLIQNLAMRLAQTQACSAGQAIVEKPCANIKFDENGNPVAYPGITSITDPRFKIIYSSSPAMDPKGCNTADPKEVGATGGMLFSRGIGYQKGSWYLSKLEVEIPWGICISKIRNRFGQNVVLVDEVNHYPQNISDAKAMIRDFEKFTLEGGPSSVKYYPVPRTREHERYHLLQDFKKSIESSYQNVINRIYNYPLPPADYCYDSQEEQQRLKDQRQFIIDLDLDMAEQSAAIFIPIERIDGILMYREPSEAGYQATQNFIEKIKKDIKDGVIQ